MGMVKRAVIAFLSIVSVAAVLGLILASPLPLRWLESLEGVNWARLSNIGQTYGAASALLTGVALIGVAGSMVFQVKAIRVSREQTAREQHVHLIEMALADPAYRRCWGSDPIPYNTDRGYRQHGYTNLVFSSLENNYLLGRSRLDALHGIFRSLFDGEAGREFWIRTRASHLDTRQGRRNRRFWLLVESEYQKAVAGGLPAVKAEVATDHESLSRLPMIRTGSALMLGAIGGIAFEAFLRQWRR